MQRSAGKPGHLLNRRKRAGVYWRVGVNLRWPDVVPEHQHAKREKSKSRWPADCDLGTPIEPMNVKTNTTQPHSDDPTPAFLACTIHVSSFHDARSPPLSSLLTSVFQSRAFARSFFPAFFPSPPCTIVRFTWPWKFHSLAFPLLICSAASAFPAYVAHVGHRAGGRAHTWHCGREGRHKIGDSFFFFFRNLGKVRKLRENVLTIVI